MTTFDEIGKCPRCGREILRTDSSVLRTRKGKTVYIHKECIHNKCKPARVDHDLLSFFQNEKE